MKLVINFAISFGHNYLLLIKHGAAAIFVKVSRADIFTFKMLMLTNNNRESADTRWTVRSTCCQVIMWSWLAMEIFSTWALLNIVVLWNCQILIRSLLPSSSYPDSTHKDTFIQRRNKIKSVCSLLWCDISASKYPERTIVRRIQIMILDYARIEYYPHSTSNLNCWPI